MNAARSLREVHQEIAALQEQFSRYDADLDFERGGGRVHYAMDNDVVTCITAPWRSDDDKTFGPLFTDMEDASRAFAVIFSEYVFNSPVERPFLLVPPAHNELEGVWNSAFIKATDDSNAIEHHFSKLLKSTKGLGEFSSIRSEADLYSAIEKAVHLIYGGDSSATELRRIARLAQSGSLRRVDSALGNDGFPLIPPLSEEDLPQFKRFSEKWLVRLNGVRPERPGANEVDAEVLGFIQFINERYEVAGEKCRLCLITGDQHIFRLAGALELVDGQTFSRKYLRRPTAFLLDKEFFKRSGADQRLKRNEGAQILNSTLLASISSWMREISSIHPLPTVDSDNGRASLLTEAIQ